MHTTTTNNDTTTNRPTNGTHSATTRQPQLPMLSLDKLASMSTKELTAVYRGGSVPESIDAVSGLPTCRMLTMRGIDSGRWFNRIRKFAASSRFPWAGKTFEATGDNQGKGINRIRLFGGKTWFPFDTRIEPSAIDGKPCIFLDYDKPENPRFIRMIRDELREVSPGLFMGPAMLDNKKSPARLVLYFACDNN